jgi:hypothetical protein
VPMSRCCGLLCGSPVNLRQWCAIVKAVEHPGDILRRSGYTRGSAPDIQNTLVGLHGGR